MKAPRIEKDMSEDGINHDWDEISIWLNPQVNVLAKGNIVEWTLGKHG